MAQRLGRRGMRSACAGIVMCALGSLCAPSARAGIINFDADGPGPAPAQQIAGLDFSVGNILGKGLASVTVGSTVELYYQATLAGVINTGGVTVAPPGLNGAPGAPSYEITIVSRSTGIVNGIAGSTLILGLNPVQVNPFVELWFDTTPDANNLAGTGFNDGTRILNGVTSQAVGNLTKTADPAQTFDQFGANNYPGLTSVTSTGSELTKVSLLPAPPFGGNPAFFLTAMSDASFNTSMITPFLQVDPSALFAGLPGGGAPAIVPLLGTINGQSGPDWQLQADANMSFTPIPEPASSALLALTSAALLGRRRKH